MKGNKFQDAIMMGDSSGLGSKALAKLLGGETNTAKRLDCYSTKNARNSRPLNAKPRRTKRLLFQYPYQVFKKDEGFTALPVLILLEYANKRDTTSKLGENPRSNTTFLLTLHGAL